jgi:AraC-like DNA-binding protein
LRSARRLRAPARRSRRRRSSSGPSSTAWPTRRTWTPLAAEAVRRLLPAQPTDLKALAASLFISERQPRRRCEAAVGLAPKLLHRILRFQRFIALAWTLERPSTQLARLAADAGYADQAHLTREAKRLEGRSPRAPLLESEQRCGCGHDHAASYGPLLAAGHPR